MYPKNKSPPTLPEIYLFIKKRILSTLIKKSFYETRKIRIIQ